MRTFSLYLLIALFFLDFSASACQGGSLGGTLSPSSTYQTSAISIGNYYAVDVTCGNIYNFSFCSNGGSATWDTQITINETDNTTQLAYNDDDCGLQSNVTWMATFTGTIHVLITEFNCSFSGSLSGTLAFNEISVGVNYSASCTTANPDISGDDTGTFSFNPVPTDGALIDPNSGYISNAVQGANYTVEYTHCGGTLVIPVTMGGEPCWNLNSDAQWLNINGENCIQLTDAVNNENGCAWSADPISFGSDFSLSLDYFFGSSLDGADGSTFTFQPNNALTCGSDGGQLGAGGIPNALTIEFDTYDNDNPVHLYDMACDHIAVVTNGDLLSPPYCGPVCAKPGGQNIDDGQLYEVEMQWDATSQQLNIYFDGNLRLSCTGDFVTNVFGGQSSVYWGATGATGGLNNLQYFCPSSVVILPVELVEFDSECNDLNEIFYWTTVSEVDLDYFILEYTYDGLVFFPESQVDAIGNSQELQYYSVRVTKPFPAQRYYRIKAVDIDGSIETSSLISSKNCSNVNDLIKSISVSENSLELYVNGTVHLSIINMLGQVIVDESNIEGSITVEKSHLSSGMYQLIVNSGKEYESRKIVIH